MAYLKVTVNREVADTYAFVRVDFESKTWLVNGTGNVTLAWSSNPVNVKVLSMDDNLIVENATVYLGEGKGTMWLNVEPEWTETWVNVTATDELTGMVGYADFKTTYSLEYLTWIMQHRYQQWTDSQIAAEANEDFWEHVILIGFGATAFFLFLTIFLKLEHKLALDQNRLSLWDRFVMRYFPMSWTDEEQTFNALLDPDKTWDGKVAEDWTASRAESRRRMIDEEIGRLEREKQRVGHVEV